MYLSGPLKSRLIILTKKERCIYCVDYWRKRANTLLYLKLMNSHIPQNTSFRQHVNIIVKQKVYIKSEILFLMGAEYGGEV